MYSTNQLTEKQIHTFNRKEETFFAFEKAFLKRFSLLKDAHECRKSDENYSIMLRLLGIILKTLVIDNDWQQVKYFCYTPVVRSVL